MATSLIETGPKLDWTRDHQMYERYKKWKKRVEMLMDSVLEEESGKAKCNYLKFWLGEEGLPLIQRWEDTGKLKYTGANASGHKLATYWTLLEEEFRPKSNRILSVIDLWTNSKQGTRSLNEWITSVYNQVELCNYKPDSKERIIRDVLIVGCTSTQAKDKIICKGEDIDLKQVLEILQVEDTTTRTMQNINSTTSDAATAEIHYARYDDCSQRRGAKNVTYSAEGSNGKNCFRCGNKYDKNHMKTCPAREAECKFCGITGHFARCCGKAGKFPKKDKNKNSTSSNSRESETPRNGSVHTVQASQAEKPPTEYWDETGRLFVAQTDA